MTSKKILTVGMETTITLTPIPPTNLALNGANVRGSILTGFTVRLTDVQNVLSNCFNVLIVNDIEAPAGGA